LDLRRKSALKTYLETLMPIYLHNQSIVFTLELGHKIGSDFLRLMELSKSQTHQDIFALNELKFKRNGFFVDFGANDGVEFSNSHLLEKEFGYKGILAEPNPKQRKNIYSQRSAIIEEDCVWSISGKTLELIDAGHLSSIKEFSDSDIYAKERLNKKSFKVKSISLTDMLDKHNAPKLIDYLSIDTEGSELEILSNHDFSKYNFSVITVEHFYRKDRDKILSLLTRNGYLRKYENISFQDDWYVLV